MPTQLDGQWWLEVDEVASFEKITRQEVYRRLKPGDARPLLGKVGSRQPAVGSQPGKAKRGTLIYARSMSDAAQERFKERRLALIPQDSLQAGPSSKALNQPAPERSDYPQSSGAGPAPGKQEAGGRRQEAAQNPEPSPQPPAPGTQHRLFPETDLDRKIAALDVPAEQRPIILGRFRAIRPLVNHDYKAQGYPSKSAFIREQARVCRVSRNTIWRWFWDYIEHEDLTALANEAPGPAATGIGSKALDLMIDKDDQAISLRAFIKERWIAGDLKKQIATKVFGYLTEKQRGCGVSFAYRFPSESTVSRYIDSLDALVHAQRLGPDALKQACGYMDRGYADLHSLDVVETDECQLNFLSYDARHWDKIVRYWVVTLYDERSAYPLAWDVVGSKDGAAKAHGITREDERRLFERLVREYGVPASIHSDRGRFRGSYWGEPSTQHRAPSTASRDAQFAPNDSIFEALGIRRNLPREKNPRGTRLERFHRFLADKARDLPGWIGSDTEERKMARGDADAAEHMARVRGEQSSTPLLSRPQIVALLNEWMEEWRVHPSDGTDMCGLSPRAVFIEQTPAAGFRQANQVELDLISAEHYPHRTIAPGGILTLPDGARYGLTGELTLLAGQKRDITRSAYDHSLIKVLPPQKGLGIIVAHRRSRVGHNDPDLLAREQEAQHRLRKLAAEMNPPVGSRRSAIGGLESGILNPESLASAQSADPRHPELSSVEYLMSKKQRHIDKRTGMFNDDAAAAVLAAMEEDEDERFSTSESD